MKKKDAAASFFHVLNLHMAMEPPCDGHFRERPAAAGNARASLSPVQ
jgi:hypothetical protein